MLQFIINLIEIIYSKIRSLIALIILIILALPYLNRETKALPHEKCSCGFKSKKYLLESPAFKAWLINHSEHFDSKEFSSWKQVCFCGKEKLNK
jgi:hypothetical protein